jgi:hypothetical protein
MGGFANEVVQCNLEFKGELKKREKEKKKKEKERKRKV